MKKKSLAAVGASIVTTLSVGALNAAENPFALKDLASGYAQVAEAAPADQAKKPEAKCGAEVMKGNPEMKCGASMMDMSKSNAPTTPPANEAAKKATEMKCAGMKMDNKTAAPTEAPKQ
jgi:uncharacterized low-complexity protein